MTDTIEREISIAAPIATVWDVITRPEYISQWFFYTDHGSDFTVPHMEQVAADLPMELIFSQVSIPRGRGKVERFFRSVEQLLLQDLPGYAPKGSTGVKATLTLPAIRATLSDLAARRLSYPRPCRNEVQTEGSLGSRRIFAANAHVA
jgi:transposase InsO family protein